MLPRSTVQVCCLLPMLVAAFLSLSAFATSSASSLGATTEAASYSAGLNGAERGAPLSPEAIVFVSEAWPRRLERAATHNVVRMDRELDSPLAREAHDLDLVTLMFSHHDVVANRLDRRKLDTAAALKPGGSYVLADHRAAPGSGIEAARALHRIDGKMMRGQFEAAGFVFVESAEFLHEPTDTGKEQSFELGLNTDRFVLEFKKPDAS